MESFRDWIEELLTTLGDVHLDKRERYQMQVTNSNGTFPQIVGREEYLEFHLEAAINDLMNMLDVLDQKE